MTTHEKKPAKAHAKKPHAHKPAKAPAKKAAKHHVALKHGATITITVKGH